MRCVSIDKMGNRKPTMVKTVQRRKVRRILSNIDPVGTALRWSSTVNRRTYRVPTPNSLWHMDTHLKLIRWGFAIHGCIDGHSRLIVYLKCATSMTASCVIPFFASAVVKYGLPSRVRSDFGYENLFVAMLMNVIRGLDRASHIAGRSVHNQRIERLWVDVFKEVVDFFHKEFYELEQLDLLHLGDSKCMFTLQKVYLKFINARLQFFTKACNCHKIRTERNKTPRQIWISGMLNNIHSTHTGSNEIFNEQEDLYSRIVNAFGVENGEVPILSQNEEASNLTIEINLTAHQITDITEILDDNSLSYRSKYIQIKTYLDDNV
ncbi:hypothetical protein FQR65_LT14575 [Abscondita terminalis]|nr:hypothetical protein FQR65_LT14575 [Abscondita terminalis]